MDEETFLNEDFFGRGVTFYGGSFLDENEKQVKKKNNNKEIKLKNEKLDFLKS